MDLLVGMGMTSEVDAGPYDAVTEAELLHELSSAGLAAVVRSDSVAWQDAELRGLARQLSDVIAPRFWDDLHHTAARLAPRVPQVLLASSYVDVPWELAAVEPPIDHGVPLFLGCQAAVALWPENVRRPSAPAPVISLSGDEIGVIAPDYDGLPRVGPLPGTQREASELMTRYHARRVDAHLPSVLDALRGESDFGILHIAGHAVLGATEAQSGILLDDETLLTPRIVTGLTLPSAPLVFLSADAPTVARAFLRAGARAVVLPLVTVDDQQASVLTSRFYAEALGEGVPVGEVLRRLRCRYADPNIGMTALAYRLYGDPGSVLRLIDARRSAMR